MEPNGTTDVVSGRRLDFGISVGSIMIGGRAASTLRVVAEHADL